MKTLLIDPPLEQLKYPMKGDHALGLGYVAAVLEEMGWDVRLLEVPDRSPASTEAVLAQVEEQGSRVVGLHSILFKHQEALRLARAIKETFPRVLILLGGPYVYHTAAEILRQEPAVDLILRGESEGVLRQLGDDLTDRSRWPGVRGLAFRQGDGVELTPPAPPIQDLDAIPFPARHLLAGIEGEDTFSVITSRGCPFVCSFCDSPVIWGRQFRGRSAANVAAEIEELLAGFNVRQFVFVDDVFTLNEKRTWALCEHLERLELAARGVRWACQTRVDLVDPKMLGEMAQAGCRLVIYGVEAARQDSRDAVSKGVSEEQVATACRWARDAGIRTELGFIVGLPGNDEATADDIVDFVERVDPDWVTVFPLAVFPGTDLHAAPQRHRLMSSEERIELRRRVLSRLYPRYRPPYAMQPRTGRDRGLPPAGSSGGEGRIREPVHRPSQRPRSGRDAEAAVSGGTAARSLARRVVAPSEVVEEAVPTPGFAGPWGSPEVPRKRPSTVATAPAVDRWTGLEAAPQPDTTKGGDAS